MTSRTSPPSRSLDLYLETHEVVAPSPNSLEIERVNKAAQRSIDPPLTIRQPLENRFVAVSAGAGNPAIHCLNFYGPRQAAKEIQDRYEQWYLEAVVSASDCIRSTFSQNPSSDTSTETVLDFIGRERRKHARKEEELSKKEVCVPTELFGKRRAPREPLNTPLFEDDPYRRYGNRLYEFFKRNPELKGTFTVGWVPGRSTPIPLSTIEAKSFTNKGGVLHAGGSVDNVYQSSEDIRDACRYLDTLVKRYLESCPTTDEEFLKPLAEIHWWLAHLTLFSRGSAAISEIFIQALAFVRGYSKPLRLSGLSKDPANNATIYMDLEAVTNPLHTFIENYCRIIASLVIPQDSRLADVAGRQKDDPLQNHLNLIKQYAKEKDLGQATQPKILEEIQSLNTQEHTDPLNSYPRNIHIELQKSILEIFCSNNWLGEAEQLALNWGINFHLRIVTAHIENKDFDTAEKYLDRLPAENLLDQVCGLYEIIGTHTEESEKTRIRDKARSMGMSLLEQLKTTYPEIYSPNQDFLIEKIMDLLIRYNDLEQAEKFAEKFTKILASRDFVSSYQSFLSIDAFCQLAKGYIKTDPIKSESLIASAAKLFPEKHCWYGGSNVWDRYKRLIQGYLDCNKIDKAARWFYEPVHDSNIKTSEIDELIQTCIQQGYFEDFAQVCSQMEFSSDYKDSRKKYIIFCALAKGYAAQNQNEKAIALLKEVEPKSCSNDNNSFAYQYLNINAPLHAAGFVSLIRKSNGASLFENIVRWCIARRSHEDLQNGQKVLEIMRGELSQSPKESERTSPKVKELEKEIQWAKGFLEESEKWNALPYNSVPS